MDKRAIGLRIQQARTSLGLSQEDLAYKAGIARRALQQIESGQGNPTLETLHAICIKLGLPLPVLMDEKILSPAADVDQIKTALREVMDEMGNLRFGPTSEIESLKRENTELKGQFEDLKEVWAAWKGSDHYGRSLALYFLTADRSHLDKHIPQRVRENLLAGLHFYGLGATPRARPRGKRKNP